MNDEHWLPIAGYEGLYEVSDLGRVRSVDRVIISGPARGKLPVHRPLRGQLIAPWPGPNGYLFVQLGKRWRGPVHYLVLTAFVGPRPPGMEALHGDDNRLNPRLDNLRWGTRLENVQEAFARGRMPIGERHHAARLTAEQIPAIRALLASHSQSAVAARYGVSRGAVQAIKEGKTWTHIAVEAAQ